MKAGKYTIKELFVNRYIDQIVIPEIQRDYVWGAEQVEGLLSSIRGDFDNFINAPKLIQIADKVLENDFYNFVRKRENSSNIGFIYAYNDEEYAGKYYLIDGQQRVTTIFLILLAIASRNAVLIEKFRKTYLDGDLVRFDYKVRESAHDFFVHFVSSILIGNTETSAQRWYYKEYKNDVTVVNLLQNFEVISKYLVDVDELPFYDYIENMTEFWYFDTNISEQGEELYIYMNARGEQMQSNENIKAALLGKKATIREKNQFGKLWEDWQDLFWRHKVDNENADRGFNEFLNCISGCERLMNNFSLFLSDEDFKLNGIKPNNILKDLDLDIIENYTNAIIFLEENKIRFKQQYEYSDWIDQCLAELWYIFNNESTNWHSNYRDANRGTERNRMVFVWGILGYMTKLHIWSDRVDEIFRTLRFFFLRYKNFNRSVASLETTINELKAEGILNTDDREYWDIESEEDGQGAVEQLKSHEEIQRNLLLRRFLGQDQRQVEATLWQIEDHPYNLDGRDVGGINFSYLTSLDTITSGEMLKRIQTKFYELFPIGKKKFPKIQAILFYYGRYWYRKSPDYYFNFQFDDWRRIIRNRVDIYDGTAIDAFGIFWKEFVEYQDCFDAFFELKSSGEFAVNHKEETDLTRILHWYSRELGEKMWLQGNFIAVSNGDYCSLPDPYLSDQVFPEEYRFYNTKGNLKGGHKQELFELLPADIQAEFQLEN